MNFFTQILIGFLIADFIAGIFHWFEDSYLDFNTEIPILSNIGKDNALHHYFPREIVFYSNFENMQVTLPLALIVFALLYLLIPLKTLLRHKVLLITFFCFSVSANIIHKYSHMRECELPFIINILQKTFVLQPHSYHSKHHKDPGSKYCVISPFLNIFLDYLLFWRVIENIIYSITGVKPKHIRYDYYESIKTSLHKEAETVPCPRAPTKNDIDLLLNNLSNFY